MMALPMENENPIGPVKPHDFRHHGKLRYSDQHHAGPVVGKYATPLSAYCPVYPVGVVTFADATVAFVDTT